MKDQKKFAVTLVLMIAVNAAAIAAWWYVFNTTEKEKGRVQETLLEIDAGEKRLDNARSLNNLLKNTEKETEKISAIFLNSKNIVRFIEELEFLNQKAGTSLAMKSAQLPEQTGVLKPQFSFQVKGSFRDLFKYLSLLENISYQIKIDRVSFAKPEGENWRIDFELTLLSYENI